MGTVVFYETNHRGTGHFWRVTDAKAAASLRQHYGYTEEDEPFGPFPTEAEAVADRDAAMKEIGAL